MEEFMIRIKQGALVALLSLVALPVVASKHQVIFTFEGRTSSEKKEENTTSAFHYACEKIASAAKFVKTNIIVPVVKGAILGCSYFVGTEGLEKFARYCGMKAESELKEYDGILKIVGKFATCGMGAELIDDSNYNSTERKLGLWRLSLGGLSAVITAMLLHKKFNPIEKTA
jgi:hypothetical protein